MIEPVVSSRVTGRDYFWFNFGWQWIQFWVVIVHCDFSLSKESHVLQKTWSSFNHKVAHSCDHLVSKAKVSSKSHAGLSCCCKCPCFPVFGLLALRLSYPPSLHSGDLVPLWS